MGNSNEVVISAKDMSVTFNDIKLGLLAIDDITFDIKRGEFVSILGPSGCGKSTLFRAIADLLDQKTILTDISGSLQVLDGPPELARKQRKVGVVFQKPTLLEWKTVAGNISLPLDIIGMKKEQKEDRITKLLKLVDLEKYRNYRPSQISGGMQQRVSIARALAYDPEILLMDEPFSALDEIKRKEMNDELIKIWKDTSKTILFVTHSIQEAVYLSEKIIVLSESPGRIKGIIDIDMDYPRDKYAGSEEFFEHQNKVRQIFN
jgi:NitT/TauT family transport system ATP-binding protein